MLQQALKPQAPPTWGTLHTKYQLCQTLKADTILQLKTCKENHWHTSKENIFRHISLLFLFIHIYQWELDHQIFIRTMLLRNTSKVADNPSSDGKNGCMDGHQERLMCHYERQNLQTEKQGSEMDKRLEKHRQMDE